MTSHKRLDRLSDEVKLTFKPSFLFKVTDNNIQHLPIREWTSQQILTTLDELLPNYKTDTWNNYLICYRLDTDLILILPKFKNYEELTTY